MVLLNRSLPLSLFLLHFRQEVRVGLPDNKRIAVQRTSSDDPDEYVLETVSIESGTERRLGTGVWSDRAQLTWLRDGSGILFTVPESKTSFNAQLWEVTYPVGNTLRITNDLNYYAGTSITGDDVTLATTQLSFASNLSIAAVGTAGPFSEPHQITSGVGRADGLAGIWRANRPDHLRVLHVWRIASGKYFANEYRSQGYSN